MDFGQLQETVRTAACTAIQSGSYQRYSGPYCEQLATGLGRRLQASHVLLTCSGTAAMELALRASGVGAGDEVLLSAYDYPGNFWAIERLGARPVLLDVEPNGWRIAEAGLQKIWEESSRYKALLVSHLHGQLQNTAAIARECKRRGLILIEDACQAIGGTLEGQPVGSFGHASIISFGGGKILSAGRGGALLTNDPELAQRAKIFSGGGSGPYGLSELQAAIVDAQLTWLDDIIATGRSYFASIIECLQNSNRVGIPFATDLSNSSFYQAGFLVPRTSDSSPDAPQGAQQGETIARLLAQQLPAGSGFAGFHRRSARRCRQAYPLYNTAGVVARTVTLHHHAAMTHPDAVTDIARILDAI